MLCLPHTALFIFFSFRSFLIGKPKCCDTFIFREAWVYSEKQNVLAFIITLPVDLPPALICYLPRCPGSPRAAVFFLACLLFKHKCRLPEAGVPSSVLCAHCFKTPAPTQVFGIASIPGLFFFFLMFE